MVDYFNPLTKLYEENRDQEKAIAMKKYLKDQFDFFGIKAPDRDELSKQFVKEYGLPDVASVDMIVKDLWELPEREYQYTALFILDRMKKHWTKDTIQLFEFLVIHKSWWDTVDSIAVSFIGILLKKYPALIMEYVQRWTASDNMWLNRTAILFQLKYKDTTDEQLLFSIIKRFTSSKEFFIQKAIGWALREYSKTMPEVVKSFVEANELAPLSKREALKVINKEDLVQMESC